LTVLHTHKRLADCKHRYRYT